MENKYPLDSQYFMNLHRLKLNSLRLHENDDDEIAGFAGLYAKEESINMEGNNMKSTLTLRQALEMINNEQDITISDGEESYSGKCGAVPFKILGKDGLGYREVIGVWARDNWLSIAVEGE